jgi:hypothetical protein
VGQGHQICGDQASVSGRSRPACSPPATSTQVAREAERACQLFWNAQAAMGFIKLLAAALGRARQLHYIERLKSVDCLDRLSVHIPFEHPQHDLVRREIDQGEAVLFDRLHWFL